ncbi:MAG: NirD/YgiW/YdeI family stress tolerance protein [Treponema sp.]|nr:NirD/YgiW/YdeI family stress tolerance protein [Treponema sp.]
MNRKFHVYVMLALICTGSTLYAQEGYRGPGADIVTVKAAKSLRDDYPVTLRGKIEKFLGDDKYLFTDDTGSIVIEIDNRLWRGISVDQNDTVEITGEVDRGFTRTEIEASGIKKI